MNNILLVIIWGRIKEEGNQLTPKHLRPRFPSSFGKKVKDENHRKLARFGPVV